MAATADIVAYIGDALVVVMCAAQAPTYWRAVRVLKTVEHISVLPSVGLFANFITWILYAVVKEETNVLQVNVMGLSFSLLYFAVLLVFARGSHWWRLVQLLSGAIVLLAVVECSVIFSSLSVDSKVLATGLIACGCNVGMFSAPLLGIAGAVRKMDATTLPVLLILANTSATVVWGSYGVLTSNMCVLCSSAPHLLRCSREPAPLHTALTHSHTARRFIWAPNIAGLAINASQVAALAYITVRGPKYSSPSGDESSNDDSGGDSDYSAVNDGLLSVNEA